MNIAFELAVKSFNSGPFKNKIRSILKLVLSLTWSYFIVGKFCDEKEGVIGFYWVERVVVEKVMI